MLLASFLPDLCKREMVREGADNVGLAVSAYLERQVEDTVILTEHY